MNASGMHGFSQTDWMGRAIARIAATRTNESWNPGLKNSLVSQARIANAAAARLLTGTDSRSNSGAIRTKIAITVARTQLALMPTITAYTARKGMIKNA